MLLLELHIQLASLVQWFPTPLQRVTVMLHKYVYYFLDSFCKVLDNLTSLCLKQVFELNPLKGLEGKCLFDIGHVTRSSHKLERLGTTGNGWGKSDLSANLNMAVEAYSLRFIGDCCFCARHPLHQPHCKNRGFQTEPEKLLKV